jgi:hypothetical protein
MRTLFRIEASEEKQTMKIAQQVKGRADEWVVGNVFAPVHK